MNIQIKLLPLKTEITVQCTRATSDLVVCTAGELCAVGAGPMEAQLVDNEFFLNVDQTIMSQLC